jgi:predicted DNA binding CopG/RHH family protein
MKKNLTSAKAPLPKFKTEQAEAEYFDKHSVAELWDQLPEAKPVKLSAALAKKIRERHARTKFPISIRLEPEQIEAAKHIAAAKSVAYQTQLRMWIAEGIRREGKRA